MKVCPTCKIGKPLVAFNKHSKTSDGLQTRCRECEKDNRKYVDTVCSICGESKKRRKYQLKVWDGKCRSCAQKIELAKFERKERQREFAKEQVLKQGGIPNAKHFTSDGVKGSANYNWKGGITPDRLKERSSAQSQYWRKDILSRDNYTCQLCFKIGGKLQAHHKKEWANYPELRHELENGVTLCESCHKNKAHRGSWRNIPTDWEILEKENKWLD